MFASRFITRATLTLAALTLMGCNDNLTAPTGSEEPPHGTPELPSPPPLSRSLMGSSTESAEPGSATASVSAATMTSTLSVSSLALGTAYTRGSECSSGWRRIRPYFPNITSISGQRENTYFGAVLFRWNGAQWVQWDTRLWNAGVSDRNGNQVIGYIASIYPYSWLFKGTPVLENYTHQFSNLTPGFYRVGEYYEWQNGAKASQWTRFNGTSSQVCQIS